MKRDEDARLIFQLKTKRCTTNKNVFADLSLTEESFVSEEDAANKITISSIEDIPTIGSPVIEAKVDNKSKNKKPLSFEFIGPSRYSINSVMECTILKYFCSRHKFLLHK